MSITITGWYDVIEYGANNTGEVDCTKSINDAIGAIPASGGVLYFPPGTYLVNSPHAEAPLVDIPSNVTIRGAGKGATVINCGSPTASVFQTVAGANNVTIQELKILLDKSVEDATAGAGIRLQWAHNVRIRDVVIQKMYQGIAVLGSGDQGSTDVFCRTFPRMTRSKVPPRTHHEESKTMNIMSLRDETHGTSVRNGLPQSGRRIMNALRWIVGTCAAASVLGAGACSSAVPLSAPAASSTTPLVASPRVRSASSTAASEHLYYVADGKYVNRFPIVHGIVQQQQESWLALRPLKCPAAWQCYPGVYGQAITFDNDFRLYAVVERGNAAGTESVFGIEEFAAGASGKAKPIRTLNLAGYQTMPVTIVVDSAGYIYTATWMYDWVSAAFYTEIYIFAPGSSGNAAPVSTITENQKVDSLALDGSGTLYALGNQTIEKYRNATTSPVDVGSICNDYRQSANFGLAFGWVNKRRTLFVGTNANLIWVWEGVQSRPCPQKPTRNITIHHLVRNQFRAGNIVLDPLHHALYVGNWLGRGIYELDTSGPHQQMPIAKVPYGGLSGIAIGP